MMYSDNTFNAAHFGNFLFHHDPLTTLDYFASFKRNFPLDSEKRLMLAVLEDAVECYEKYLLPANAKDKSLFDDAESWIFDRDEPSLFSFENICDALGLAPDWLRSGLLRRKERMLAGRRRKEPVVLELSKIKRRPRRRRRTAA